MSNRVFRNIPSVNELLETPALQNVVHKLSHNVVVGEVRSFLDNLRHELQTRTEEVQLPTTAELSEKIARFIKTSQRQRLVPAINATGVLLHTGLGRAPMAAAAIDAMAAISGSYATLEIDAATGARGQRVSAVEHLLREVTGAEAATVVNNNAGATMLTLAALANGREVIVSRGELIEIGGSYRLPDVMAAGGAILREVGTTNKTRLADYANAIVEATAALMKVHTSNYRIVGFTETPDLAELVSLGHRHNKLVIDDIGSGALLELSRFGVTGEPVAKQSIAGGADVVLFSGDKLLGGPQCGIIVGRRGPIQTIMAHPLMRALRVGKSTLAGLAATLEIYRDPERAIREIPILSLLSTSLDNLKGRAERVAAQIAASPLVSASQAIPTEAQLGGGSVPAQPIQSFAIAVTPLEISVDALATRLRTSAPAVFGRIRENQLLLDLRGVSPAQDSDLVAAFAASVPDASANASPSD